MTECPCCSGTDFDECCGPFLSGEKEAPTAVALMRSRYTAYVKNHIDYIERTMHPQKRREFDEAAAKSWSEKAEWLGLEIVTAEAGGEGDTEGEVEFLARYVQNDEEEDHHERAKFSRVGDKWYFVDGKFVGKEPFVRSQPKVGRNEPCPCGSGKKSKKCCGK